LKLTHYRFIWFVLSIWLVWCICFVLLNWFYQINETN